jgi:hypothetical protein
VALDKDAPIPRPVTPPGDDIVAIAEVGGLHIDTNAARPERAARWCDAPEPRTLTTRPRPCDHDKRQPSGLR